ncbi:MAG: DUF4340 domain-containing protein [Gammaproteobacteria bacterium]|nr:DUF4340 domain-containing protein [Gammaproteobacteria bacterium]
MSKINILNLVLFIVVISLAFVIYYSEEESIQLDRLTNFDVNDINSINIQHNKDKVTLTRNDSKQWDITQPVFVAANDFRISSLLKLINAPVHKQYSIDKINLTDTGLSNPTTKISFDDQFITFGTSNPATSLRYVRLNDTVFTIEDVYHPLISSHFGTLVSLNLLPNNSRIEKLVLKNQTISKDEKGLWQSNIEITADNINKTIEHWQSIQAFGVHKYLKREELGEVFIYITGNQEPVTYVITDTDPWLILARPELELEYHLDVEAYKKLIEPR